MSRGGVRRFGGLLGSALLLSLGCGRGTISAGAGADTGTTGAQDGSAGGSSAGGSSGGATGNTGGGTGPETNVPTDETSSASTTPEGIYGEWLGQYSGDSLDFNPCGSQEGWSVHDLPPCHGRVFLRVRGWLGTTGGGNPLLRTDEIVEGPCAEASCDAPVPMWDCGSFEEACNGNSVVCDLVAQDCPDPSWNKCSPYASVEGECCVDDVTCVPIVGEQQLGEPCTRTADNDDCGSGLFCLTEPAWGTGQGVCMLLCHEGWVDCAPSEACVGPAGLLPLCAALCNPLSQDCADGGKCILSHDTWTCELPVYPSGNGDAGTACEFQGECQKGLACIQGRLLAGCPADGCCSPFCELSGDGSECTEPVEQCVPWYEPGQAPDGLESLGYCGVP